MSAGHVLEMDAAELLVHFVMGRANSQHYEYAHKLLTKLGYCLTCGQPGGTHYPTCSKKATP